MNSPYFEPFAQNSNEVHTRIADSGDIVNPGVVPIGGILPLVLFIIAYFLIRKTRYILKHSK